MKLFKYSLLVSVLLVLGCSDIDLPKGKGYLKLSTVSEGLSKAAISTDNFVVTIRRSNDDAVYSAIRVSYPDLYELAEGEYYVEAEFPGKTNYMFAAFEQPHFYGKSGALSIREDKITECRNISCSIQNMKVTVHFSDMIRENFDSFNARVSVTDDAGKEHFLDFEEFTTSEGWFEPRPLKVVFTGIRKEIEEKEEHTFTITENIGKGKYVKINLNGDWS